MSRTILAGLLFLVLWGGAAAPAAAQGAGTLRLEQDKGQIVRLPQPASSVFIANPDIADLQVMSPTMVYLFGKRPGETSLIATNSDERVLINRTVVVTANLSGLARALRERFPDRAITAESVDGAVVLSGSVASPAEAEDARRIAQRFVGAEQGDVLVRLGITGASQVMLRVRVSEVSRSVREDFGFNWEILGRLGSGYTVGLASGLTDIRAIANNGVNSLVRTPDMMNLYGSYSGERWDINGLIDALASDGLITILAEPNLVATSGETASFLAGGEFPIPVSQEDDRTSIEFKEFGVSLAFTPTVLSGERISMRVRPEVSELSSVGELVLEGARIPALRTRRAETTIELGSGQSFAIAGLLQNNVNETIDKFPFLGDVPVLGTLFRSSQFQRNETELVIIVTPYIVQPASGPAALAAPTDGISPTRFIDRVLLGRMTQPGPGARPVAGFRLSGPVGYIVE
ncbi:type II and III secretion system protein family protein [Azospirillum sp. ST 5-10]|uniref:type II and III secretion system protein family protein n=1 Tax=unclassified Azospirillum TaxID=2630922 RepID=UPI003F4A5EE9